MKEEKRGNVSSRYELIISPERREVEGPTIFLGGSIIGAEDWQSKAVDLIINHASVFNPRRPWFGTAEDRKGNKSDIFVEQVEWELDYLQKADIILFWLPKDTWGRTSRFEIGWIAGQGKPIVVGIEEGFPGERYLRHVLENRLGLKTYKTLQETCEEAVKLIRPGAKGNSG